MDELKPTVGHLVWRVAMKWRTAVDSAVSSFGLTHAQYSVLSSLRGMTHRGINPSQRELADHTGLDPIYISKLVRTMEKSGLIERSRDHLDSRTVRLAVTKEGERVADRAIAIVGGLMEQMTEPLGGLSSGRIQEIEADLKLLLAVSQSGSTHQRKKESQPS